MSLVIFPGEITYFLCKRKIIQSFCCYVYSRSFVVGKCSPLFLVRSSLLYKCSAVVPSEIFFIKIWKVHFGIYINKVSCFKIMFFEATVEKHTYVGDIVNLLFALWLGKISKNSITWGKNGSLPSWVSWLYHLWKLMLVFGRCRCFCVNVCLYHWKHDQITIWTINTTLAFSATMSTKYHPTD